MSKRWNVAITYKHDGGPRYRRWEIEEIEELQEIVESGPDWNCIISITITLNSARRNYDVTVEEAARQ